MRAAKKPVEYLPKPFSFTTIPKRSVSYVENAEQFHGKIMEEKWDLHRQIKESLAVLDPQSSRQSRCSSENQQNYANVDNYAQMDFEEATDSQMRALRKIIIKWELKLFAEAASAHLQHQIKRRAATYFNEQRRRRQCFDVMKMPDSELLAKSAECRLMLVRLRQQAVLLKLSKGVFPREKVYALESYLSKNRLKGGLKRLQQRKSQHIQISVSKQYVWLLTKQLALRRLILKARNFVTNQKHIRKNAQYIYSGRVKDGWEALRKGYQRVQVGKKAQQLKNRLKRSNLRQLAGNCLTFETNHSGGDPNTVPLRISLAHKVSKQIALEKELCLKEMIRRKQQQELLNALATGVVVRQSRHLKQMLASNQVSNFFRKLRSQHQCHRDDLDRIETVRDFLKQRVLHVLNQHRRQQLMDKFRFNILLFKKIKRTESKVFRVLKSKAFLKDAQHELIGKLEQHNSLKTLRAVFHALKRYSRQDSQEDRPLPEPRQWEQQSVSIGDQPSEHPPAELPESSNKEQASSEEQIANRKRLPERAAFRPSSLRIKDFQKAQQPQIVSTEHLSRKVAQLRKKHAMAHLLNQLQEMCLFTRRRQQLGQLRLWTYFQAFLMGANRLVQKRRRYKSIEEQDNEDIKDFDEEESAFERLLEEQSAGGSGESSLAATENVVSQVQSLIRRSKLVGLVKHHKHCKDTKQKAEQIRKDRLATQGKKLIGKLVENTSHQSKIAELVVSKTSARLEEAMRYLREYVNTQRQDNAKHKQIQQLRRLTGLQLLLSRVGSREQLKLSLKGMQASLNSVLSKQRKIRGLKIIFSARSVPQQSDRQAFLRSRLIHMSKLHMMRRLKKLIGLRRISRLFEKYRTSSLANAFRLLGSFIKLEIDKEEQITTQLTLLHKKTFLRKLKLHHQRRQTIAQAVGRLTEQHRHNKIELGITTLSQFSIQERKQRDNQSVLILLRQRLAAKSALLMLNDHKQLVHIRRLKLKRDEQMIRYAQFKRQELLKKKSFSALKQIFLANERSKRVALLTKCMQGWRNLHAQNLLLGKYLSEYDQVSYYPRSIEQKLQFQQLRS